MPSFDIFVAVRMGNLLNNVPSCHWLKKQRRLCDAFLIKIPNISITIHWAATNWREGSRNTFTSFSLVIIELAYAVSPVRQDAEQLLTCCQLGHPGQITMELESKYNHNLKLRIWMSSTKCCSVPNIWNVCRKLWQRTCVNHLEPWTRNEESPGESLREHWAMFQKKYGLPV